MRILILLLLIFNFTSCSHSNKNTKKTYNLVIEPNDNIGVITIPNVTNVSVDSIFSEINYIVLEDKPEFFFNEATSLRCYKNRIYIFDFSTNSLLIYKKDGKCIKKLGRKGRGPGEFNALSNFAIDYKNDLLYVGDRVESKFLIFDLDGNYIKRIPSHYAVGNFAIQNNGNIVHESSMSTFGINMDMTQSENIEILNEKGEQLYCGFDYDYNRNIELIFDKLFVNKKNEVTFAPMFRDTIYSIESDRVKPIYAVNYATQRKPLPPNEYIHYNSSMVLYTKEDQNKVFFLGRHVSSLDYYYLFLGATPIMHAFYSKISAKTICFEELTGENSELFEEVHDYDEGYFYGVIENFQIDKIRKSGKYGAKFKKMLENLNDVHNPVVVYFKIKKF